jgi:N-acetylglucosaminyldiphosphoundecaprenol N-acetyl-beta-D-mannosaminyltransferase
MRVELLGTPIDILTLEETLALIETSMTERLRLQHVAINVAKLVALQRNRELAEDVAASDVVGVDGMGIVLALKLMGHRQATRVAGVDLMMHALILCHARGFRPYFLGAAPAIVRQAVANAQRRFPGLQFAGFQDGYFGSEGEDEALRRIQDSNADCLFIGMPTPIKERLLQDWRGKLNVPFIMGVGGGLDVLAGKVSRAPRWMQNGGLEWAYRIYQEPGRMWWRYASTNTRFAGMLLQLMLLRALGR